jgi:sugar phosphate permease
MNSINYLIPPSIVVATLALVLLAFCLARTWEYDKSTDRLVIVIMFIAGLLIAATSFLTGLLVK